MTSLGTKRTCQSCGAKYYDFDKEKIICPACGEAFDPEVSLKSRRIKPVAVAKPASQLDTDKIEDDDDIDDSLEEADIDDDSIDDDDDDGLIKLAKSDDEDENLDAEPSIAEDFLDSEDDEEK